MYDEDYDNEEEQSEIQNGNGNGFDFKQFYEQNKKLIIIVGGFLILLLILTIISKAGGSTGGSTSTKFDLSVNTEENLKKNSTVNVVPTITGSTNPKIEWNSSDTNVATVDNNGTISAVDLGSCVITVTVTNEKGETKTANINVTVFNGTEGVTLTDIKFGSEGLVITQGSSTGLNITTTPSDAYVSSLVYESDNQSICTVDENGLLQAISQGLCTVTVTANQTNSAEIKVFVKEEKVTTHPITIPTDLNFDKSEITLKVDEEQTINVTPTPANADTSILTFESSNSSVVKVEGNKLTGLQEGTATITVSAGSLTKTINVTVTSKTVELTGISVGNESVSMNVNGTEQITVTTIPEDATEVKFNYTSSDSSVATVSSTGLITGVKAGTTTITITANNGGNDVTKTINVTVNGSSGTEDPPSGGGCSSVGYINVTSDKNAVEKTYTDANKAENKKTAPVVITMKLGNCTDTIKYCTYAYGSTACTPNKTYSAPFTINANGITVIRYTVYYNGNSRSDDPSERFVNLTGGTTTTTTTSYCWRCQATSSSAINFIWGTSQPMSTCTKTLATATTTQNACNKLNRGNFCFKKTSGTDANKWFWGRDYATTSGYHYAEDVNTEASCLERNV